MNHFGVIMVAVLSFRTALPSRYTVFAPKASFCPDVASISGLEGAQTATVALQTFCALSQSSESFPMLKVLVHEPKGVKDVN
jgi:hypothetical protein